MTKTYAQIAREIENLKAAAEKLLAIETRGAIAKINQFIAKYRLAASDLSFASHAVPSAAKPAKGKSLKKSAVAVAPKFRDPVGGTTWSGRGPRPQWLKQALKKRGRTLEDFLIGNAPATPAPAVEKPKAVKVAKAVKAVKASKVAKAAKAAVAPVATNKAAPQKKAVATKPVAAAEQAAASARPVKPAAKKSPARVKRAAAPKPSTAAAPAVVAEVAAAS